MSKSSVDEVFMYHFDKNVVSFWGFRPQTPTGELSLDPAGGLPFFRPPHCPPWKNPADVQAKRDCWYFVAGNA